MKKAFFLLIVLLALMLLIPASAASYTVGDTVDDFSITTVQGETLTLSELLSTHKAVLINFWFIECPWCEYEFPYLQQAYERMGDEIAVLAVSPYDSESSIRAYQQSMGLTFPMARDTAGLSRLFGCSSYPASVMIDRYGVYCFFQSGAFPTESTFLRLFRAFAAEDYDASLIGFKIPAPQPAAAMPAAEEMALALADGSPDVTFSALDGTWPWLLAEDNGRSYAYASNSGEDGTSAVLHASLKANAGDVLAFDYTVSSAAQDDYLVLYVNNEPVKIFSGEQTWQSYAYAFPQAGDYEIDFGYLKNNLLSKGDDVAYLDNVRLLSGDRAQEALASNSIWLQTIESGVSFDILNENARRVLIDDPSGKLDASYPGAQYFLVPGDSLSLRVRIGKDVDPESAILYSLYDGGYQTLRTLDSDETGYLASLPTDSLNATGFPWSALIVYPYLNDYENFVPLFWFASEEDLDFFCQYCIAEDVTAAWQYADEKAVYTLRFTDESGNPIAGVIANICTDSDCQPLVSDEKGVITFENDPYPYDIHIILAPEGYAYDAKEQHVAPKTGGEMLFILPKK